MTEGTDDHLNEAPQTEPRYGQVEDVWTEQVGQRISFTRLESGMVEMRLYIESHFSASATIASFRWDRIVESVRDGQPTGERASNER